MLNTRLLSRLMASALLLGATSVSAAGWEFLPATNDGYSAKPQFSLISGVASIDGQEETMTGVELAIDCPLLAAPDAAIRQRISLATVDEAGLELTSFELNPHYIVALTPEVDFGFGPDFGYVTAESATFNESSISLQLGASLLYRSGGFVAGLEARYQSMTGDIQNNVDIDNSRVMAKLGYRF